MRVASCSFGKDSLAAIIVAEQHGLHIDRAVYCRIMFDDTTSAELPEHEEFIHEEAIPLLKSRYGIETEIVQANVTYCDVFFRKFQKGQRQGRIYGFPVRARPWCNSRLKVPPVKKWGKQEGNHQFIIGIAADEIKRIERKTENGSLLPLVQYGITEAEAFSVCQREGLLSPAYNRGRKRLGCWFSHNQRIADLRRLRQEHPELWEKLLALDTVSQTQFTQRCSVADFDRRFAAEENQLCFEWEEYR